MGLLDILQQYAGKAMAPSADTVDHFDEVAKQSSTGDLGAGIAAALRSDATPPFGQLVGNLFGNGNSQQQAGMLNQLVQALGPAALSGVAGGVLGRVLGNAGGGAATITPEQASKLSPADVSAIAAHAEKQDPSVIDRLGAFYAEHPTLVKTLGAAALGIAMSHMGNRQRA